MLFVLAGISMVLGLHVPFLGTGLVPGLWIAFIGWFLQRASAASYARVMVEDLLQRARVADLMQRGSLLTVPPELSVDALVQDRLIIADQQAFPVTDGERFVGMVTRADVRRLPREVWKETKVGDVMTGRAALAVAAP